MGVSGRSTFLFFFLSIPLTVLAEPIELTSPLDPLGRFGFSVSGVPDTNGDGRGDVIVGAPGEDIGSATDAGRAYLYDGSTGALLQTFVSPFPEEKGEFGNAVAGIPDLNGDGFGDVLIGAHREDWRASYPPSDNGRVYVFDGSNGTLLRDFISPRTGEMSGRFGGAVAGVPDVNGDGCWDVLVGAAYENPGSTRAGQAYIFDGSSGLLLHTLVSPRRLTYELFGGAVAGIPDVNGDGRGDVVIGKYGRYGSPPGGYWYQGSAYVFDGSGGMVLYTLSPPKLYNNEFGFSVAGFGDLNADGRGDVIVGARADSRAYIFDGSSGVLLETIKPQEVSSLSFGWSITAVPDTTGDGHEDIAISGWDSFWDKGYVHVYDGVTRRLFQRLESPGRQIFGWSVAGIPDANGDGKGDLIVGASKFADRYDSPIRNFAAYIFYSPFLSPEIALSPPSLDFGERTVDTGTGNPMNVVITNAGDDDLIFTGAGMEITGEDAEAFAIVSPALTTPLAPGATREVSVVFEPHSVGEKLAYLTVFSNP